MLSNWMWSAPETEETKLSTRLIKQEFHFSMSVSLSLRAITIKTYRPPHIANSSSDTVEVNRNESGAVVSTNERIYILI